MRLLAVALLAAANALAQPFPARPITIVVPFPTGAANDIQTRLLVDALQGSLGAIVVDNKPGAGALVGSELVRRAKPDGYTLLVSGNQALMATAIGAAGTIGFVRDFDPIVITARLPFFLTVNREAVNADSVRELVALARAHPGKFSYATPGNGSPHHFGVELLKMQTGIDVVHVPYKGMGQGAIDLAAGRVQMTITGFPAIAPHMKSGKLKLLANAGEARSAFQPEVPTMAEGGVPGVSVESWIALLAPAGTPRDVIGRINTEVNVALKQPALREKFAAQGLEAAGGTPEALGALMRAELERWQRVAKAAGINPD